MKEFSEVRDTSLVLKIVISKCKVSVFPLNFFTPFSLESKTQT